MRISVTDLDRLVYYRNADYQDPTIDEIVSELRREGEETVAMRRGKAFHRLLESVGDDELSIVEQDGFAFNFTLEHSLVLPPICELKGEYRMFVSGTPVTLSGVVDVLDGKTIHDHKLTGRFNQGVYEESIQWRCYLLMFCADRFQYNVFEQSTKKDGTINVKAMHKLTFYRYPALREDVESQIVEFVEFCKLFCPELLDDSRDIKQAF